MGEAIEAGFAVVATHATLAEAAKGQTLAKDVTHCVVYAHATGSDFRKDAFLEPPVFSEEIQRKWRRPFTQIGRRLVQPIKWNNR